MGINLAIMILEGTLTTSSHGGINEAIDELIRESFWMTDEEVRYVLSLVNEDSDSGKSLLVPVMKAEQLARKQRSAIDSRVN